MDTQSKFLKAIRYLTGISVIAAALLTACAGAAAPIPAAPTGAANSVPATGPESTVTTPAGPVGDPAARQAVIDALQAYQKAGPYRVDSTINANGKTEQMTAEVILPDRFHLKMPSMELLAVGGKTYIKRDDKWVSFPMDIGSFLSGFTTSVNQDLINRMSNFKVVGSDVINGSPTMVYQFDTTYGAGNQSASSVNKLWVDIARGLPVKQEITGSAGGVQSTTVQIITFDPNITIQPPQ